MLKTAATQNLFLLACFAWLGIWLGSSPEPQAAGLSDSISISSHQTHGRMTFSLDDSVAAIWTDVPGGFEILFKGITLADLGAPFGGEAEWIKRRQAETGDPRIDAMGFKESEDGVRIIGKWKFPRGADAPADPKMEHFSYRDQDPSRFVVDFWLKSGPTRAEMARLDRKRDLATALKKSSEEAKRRSNRRIASERARLEAEDLLRFCRAPLSEEKDVFLKFLPVHEKFDLARFFPTTTPDSTYIYHEPKGKDEASQYIRTALKLYREGKIALVVKVLDFFEKEHPKSEHRLEMSFLRANALVKLNLEREAQDLLNRIKTDGRGTPVALYAGMYHAAKLFEAGQSLQALEAFLWLSGNYGTHRMSWVFHMGAAETLYALKQTGRAAKEYQWVTQYAPNRLFQAEAALRLGDLFLERFQYDRALAAYAQSLSLYGTEAKSFPAVYVNRSEALYGLGQYARVQEAMEDYMKSFASHPMGWRVSYRLGEVLGRQPGEKAQAESRKWFYETINRYPYSAGATLARARLLPCGDHGGFSAEGASRFYSTEAATLKAESEIRMDAYTDFMALSRVRAMTSFDDPESAVTAAIEELKRVKSQGATAIIRQMSGVLFRKAIVTRLEKDQALEALTFYRKFVSGVDTTQGDPAYLLKLSQAASDMGLGELATQLAQSHRSLSRNPAQESSQDLDIRLAVSEQRFSEAKALWVASGIKAESRIRELLAQVVEEHPQAWQKEIILGRLDEKAEKFASALGHASRAQLLLPGKPRLTHWLADLQAQAGNSMLAVDLYRSLEAGLESSKDDSALGMLGLPPVASRESLAFVQGEILSKQGKWGEAAAAYGRAVDAAAAAAGNQLLYEYARALDRSESSADRVKSVQVMQRIVEGKTEDFWKRLAREALANREKSDAREGRL